ncbi:MULTISPECIES: OmpA family protein [Deefgea]|uniref:OmpA family protein n=1 Tax=Deefgea chitinilytica TaxID=570276 RepID=A0ABS2CBH0_9NEIS|nr:MULTISPECIES: OmpA family protein [Deefgea]MBM5571502.1 OmpA family protein [Deefgea chitinilytica]MBM9888735.1 OmpA family protein [Deefgea sp. CFH1-16]
MLIQFLGDLMVLNTEEKIGVSVGLVVSAIAIGAALFATKLLPATGQKTAVAASSVSAASKEFVLGEMQMVLADGKITFTGRVADEASKQRLLKPARLLWGADHVIDHITVEASAPAFWWAGRPIEVLARLKQLKAFDLKLANEQVVLSGEAGSSKLADGIQIGLSQWFKPGAAVLSQLNVVEDAQLSVWHDDVLLNESIEFATGSAAVSAASEPRLKEIAAFLLEDGRVIRILGYTDNVGEPAANQKLSQDRAAAVRITLIKFGVKGEQLVAVGMGQERPIADNSTEAGRQKNRRIEFAQ